MATVGYRVVPDVPSSVSGSQNNDTFKHFSFLLFLKFPEELWQASYFL